MRSVRTVKWGVAALVLCAGLAALKSGIAQETSQRDEARDETSDTPRAAEEREREMRREQESMERGERGRSGERGGKPGRVGGYGRGGEGYGGYGRGYGGGYGAAGGEMGGEIGPKEMLGRAKFKADSLQNVTKKFVMMQAQPETMNRIRDAAKALVDAEDDDAREDAERNLNEQLDEYFEEDMKRREEELANVERRVKELRELLERRREKKDDIIRLQVDVLQNEANGLGFFSTEGPGGPQGSNFLFWQAGPGAGLPPGPQIQAVPPTPYAPGASAAPVLAPVPVKR